MNSAPHANRPAFPISVGSKVALSLLLLFHCAQPCQAERPQVAEISVETITFRDTVFRVARVEPSRLRLFSKESDPHISIKLLGKRLRDSGKNLLFATNAGMYLKDFSPQGLHIEEGKEVTPINLGNGEPMKEEGRTVTPNFYLRPNGVFFVTPAGAAGILESSKFAESKTDARLATQSGPLLIQDGKIHPKFREGSESRKHRNGVGIDSSGKAVFAITADSESVNFYDFAKLFEHLECTNALYLDGVISVMTANPKPGKEPPVSLGGVIAVLTE